MPRLKLLLTLALILSSCRVYRTHTPAEVYDLSQRQKEKLEVRATSQNDGDAAFKLYKYYQYTVQDLSARDFWGNKAAELGNSDAIHDVQARKNENPSFKANREKKAGK